MMTNVKRPTLTITIRIFPKGFRVLWILTIAALIAVGVTLAV